MDPKAAMDWYDQLPRISLSGTEAIKSRQKIKKVGKITTTINSVLPKTMYFFSYKAETVKIYDVYPLIFPIRLLKGAMLGINFHYLDFKDRASLFDHMSGKSLRWEAFKNKKAKRCIKRYNADRFLSPLYKIPKEEWICALFLPAGKFIARDGGGVIPKSLIWV